MKIEVIHLGQCTSCAYRVYGIRVLT